MLRQTCRPSLALLGICLMLLAPVGAARASTLTVIGDVNAGSAGNLTLYGNVLGDGREVLFARNFGPLSGVVGYYRTLGATVSELQNALTAPKLAGVDLLVLTAGYDAAFNFTPAELAVARLFGEAGGTILMAVEATAAASLTSYSAAIEAIGGRIRFTGQRFASTETLTDLPDTPLTEGMTSFRVTPYNTLTGGTPVVVAANGVAIATEPLGVPAPVNAAPALPLLAGALAMLGLLRRRRT